MNKKTKILHIRFSTREVEEYAKREVLPKLKEELPDDVLILFSYVWKHGIGKRINEVEIELIDMGERK